MSAMKFNILIFVILIYPTFFIQTCDPTEELSCYSCFDFDPPNPYLKSKGGPCFEVKDETDVKYNCQFCSTRKSQSRKEETFVIERDCITAEKDVEWIKTLELNQWIDYNDTNRFGFVRYCNDSNYCNTQPFLKQSSEVKPTESTESNPKFYSDYKFIIVIAFVCVFIVVLFAVLIGIFFFYKPKKAVKDEANAEMEDARKISRQVTSVAVVNLMESNNEGVNQEMKEKNKHEADQEENNATPTHASSIDVDETTNAFSTNVAETTNALSTNVDETTNALSTNADETPKVASSHEHDPFSSEA